MDQSSVKARWEYLLVKHADEVCPRWKESFEAFASDMGERTREAPCFTRIDRTKPFGPGNCCWAKRDDVVKEPKWHKVPLEEMPLLLEMVELGTPIRTVAKAFEITEGAVRNILCRRGISASQRRLNAPKLTAEIAATIRQRYGWGESVRVMAEEYGVSMRSIYNVLDERTWKRRLAPTTQSV